jgi:hypothetical protein
MRVALRPLATMMPERETSVPSVVPSQIVKYIDTALAFCLGSPPRAIGLSQPICGTVNGLVRLVEEMPNVLLPNDPQVYAEFIQSLEYVRFAVKNAENHNFYSQPPSFGNGPGWNC